MLELLADVRHEAGVDDARDGTDPMMPALGIWDVDSFSLLQVLVTLEDEFRLSILTKIDQFDGDSVDDFVDFIVGREGVVEAGLRTSAPLQVPLPQGDADRLRTQS